MIKKMLNSATAETADWCINRNNINFQGNNEYGSNFISYKIVKKLVEFL